MRRLVLLTAAATLMLVAGTVAFAKLPEDQGFSLAFQGDPGRIPSATADYLYDLPSGGHWLAGDRSGYDCAYTFLEYQGQLIGRVAFHRVDAASGYMQVNDRFMAEGLRYYDGEINTRSDVGDTGSMKAVPPLTNTSTIDACITSQIDYLAVPEQSLPVIRFFVGETLIETRDYANAVVEGEGHFGLLEATPERTAVAFISGRVVVGVVYYTPLNGATITTNDAAPPTITTTPPPVTTTTTTTPTVTETQTVTVTETVTQTDTVTVPPPESCGEGDVTLADGRTVGVGICA